jgi:hypothetical protein
LRAQFSAFVANAEVTVTNTERNQVCRKNPNGFGSTNNTSTLFGQITTFRAPRRIQLGVKLTF